MVYGSKVNDPFGGRGNKTCLVLPDSTSVVIEEDANSNDFDNEQTEIFDFYSIISHTFGVHALD